MYVLGAAGVDDRWLTIRRPADSPFIISTRSEEELSGRLRTQMYITGTDGVSGVDTRTDRRARKQAWSPR